MLELVKEIKKNGLNETVEKYGLKLSEQNNLILLKYSQIHSKHKTAMACRQARGIILKKDTFDVVSISFTRFFNHGESGADSIIFDRAKVLKKEDGSLMTMYFYNGQWRVQTTGMIDANGSVGNHEFSFAELFWKTFNDNGGRLDKLDKNKCYCFELCTVYNQVVALHQTPHLVLLNVRNRMDYSEATYKELVSIGEQIGIKTVEAFDFNNLSEVINAKDTLHMEDEGYVVWDDTTGKRIKLKNAKYVLMHQTKNNSFNPDDLFTIVKANELDEFLATFPMYKKQLEDMQKWYLNTQSFLKEYDKVVESLVQDVGFNRMSRKEFAQKVFQDLGKVGLKRLTGACFRYLDGDSETPSESFVTQRNDKLYEIYKNN